jgi:hypothetical protein
MAAVVIKLHDFDSICFNAMLVIALALMEMFNSFADLIIDLMAKKMSLPVRTASPAPSSGPRAISISSSNSNW